jgi:hypothetical protein
MKKSEFNAKFREHAKEKLSPTKGERSFVGLLYSEFQKILNGKCIQIGSYPRFTATTPIHDLDILYIVGQYNPRGVDPTAILKQLQDTLNKNFSNPTRYQYKIALQTHSVTVAFLDKDKEIFFVDIVPAYISDKKNEFGDETYWVPEIVNVGYSKRKDYYKKLAESRSSITWIKSDPRGYISVAQTLNEKNVDFRKVVKFIKAWKFGCKSIDDDFKFKSFHIEQVVAGYFRNNINVEFFDAVFKFYLEVPNIISRPQITDRADSNKFIDDYIKHLSDNQKQKIIEARDNFLIKLERLNKTLPTEQLLAGAFYKRKNPEEKFIYDFSIPTFIDDTIDFMVDGYVKKIDGFRSGYWLSQTGDQVVREMKIQFKLTKDGSDADLRKWKVRNSDDSGQPRGEITDNQTKNNPESTKFIGKHYVECSAIKNNVCVARHRRNVIVK